MTTSGLNGKQTEAAVYITTGLFLTASIISFTSIRFPYGIAMPVTILTISSLLLCPWQITLALLFSATGDCMGIKGHFQYQIAAFAIAHILYILFFIKRYHEKVEHDGKLTNKAKGYFTMVGFCTLAILAAAFFIIAPEAEAGTLRTGICVYAVIIGTMMVTALLQRSSLYALGAVLFVFSDFILAWNMFVAPVPHSSYMILVPYFAAQWLIFIRSTKYRIAPEMRILRF